MEKVVAPLTDHDNVLVPPLTIEEGDALNDVITGTLATALATVTETTADVVWFPAASRAIAVNE
jgi:hypothetical protein